MKGKIEKIEMKTADTKFGVKDFALITISGKVVSTFKQDIIEQISELGVGSSIDYITEENKKGDKTYYNLIGFEPIEKVNQNQEQIPYEPRNIDYWKQKQKQIIRENALSQANALILTLEKGERLKDLTNEQIRELLFRVAEQCEDWVLR